MTISAERPQEIEVSESTPIPTNRPAAWGGGWLSQHLGTAIVFGFFGYIFGHWLGNYISSGYVYIQGSGQNSIADLLALMFMVVGWLGGIGALNYPVAKMFGRDAT